MDPLLKDIKQLEKDVNEIKDLLKSMSSDMKKINIGLYGDEDNDVIGLIKERKLINDKIAALEKKIENIEKINSDQDIAIKAKGGLMDKLIKIAGGVAFAYLMLKDVIGVDSIFEILLKR